MRIAIRVDADPIIGGGHVMRCLSLADALRQRGAETLFVCAALPVALATRLKLHGHALCIIAGATARRRDTAWHEAAVDEADQQQDAAAFVAAARPLDWALVDHYLLGAPWQVAVRAAAGRVMVIDDLANREHIAHLLLDQTLYREPGDYAPFITPHTNLLLGPRFALLQSNFAAERPAALARRRESRAVERILVSLGTSDVGAHTVPVVQAALGACDASIDVVLGSTAPSLARVAEMARAEPRLSLHVDTDEMAQLMRDADLAIGAAGTTSWERCCLGLPALTLVVAENQARTALALQTAGASIAIDSPAAVAGVLGDLVSDRTARLVMSAAAFAIGDGRGAARVAAFLGGQATIAAGCTDVSLRRARSQDSEPLWLWRNDPVTRAASVNQAAVTWPDHGCWFAATLGDPRRTLLIAELGSRPIAMVRFDREADGQRQEVSINVAPEFRSRGLGQITLALACAEQFKRNGGQIGARVNRGNRASQRLFENCGFMRFVPRDDGDFVYYVLETARII